MAFSKILQKFSKTSTSLGLWPTGEVDTLKFWRFSSELIKTWSSGATESEVWIGNFNVKVWKIYRAQAPQNLVLYTMSAKGTHPWITTTLDFWSVFEICTQAPTPWHQSLTNPVPLNRLPPMRSHRTPPHPSPSTSLPYSPDIFRCWVHTCRSRYSDRYEFHRCLFEALIPSPSKSTMLLILRGVQFELCKRCTMLLVFLLQFILETEKQNKWNVYKISEVARQEGVSTGNSWILQWLLIKFFKHSPQVFFCIVLWWFQYEWRS